MLKRVTSGDDGNVEDGENSLTTAPSPTGEGSGHSGGGDNNGGGGDNGEGLDMG